MLCLVCALPSNDEHHATIIRLRRRPGFIEGACTTGVHLACSSPLHDCLGCQLCEILFKYVHVCRSYLAAAEASPDVWPTSLVVLPAFLHWSWDWLALVMCF